MPYFCLQNIAKQTTKLNAFQHSQQHTANRVIAISLLKLNSTIRMTEK